MKVVRSVNVAFEQTLVNSGTSVLKFYLHVSRDEQKARLLERLTQPDKCWKFNERDLDERKLWEKYEEATEDVLSATSSKSTPWYIIPADNKWAARSVVADILTTKIRSLVLKYPVVSEEQRKKLEEARRGLLGE